MHFLPYYIYSLVCFVFCFFECPVFLRIFTVTLPVTLCRPTTFERRTRFVGVVRTGTACSVYTDRIHKETHNIYIYNTRVIHNRSRRSCYFYYVIVAFIFLWQQPRDQLMSIELDFFQYTANVRSITLGYILLRARVIQHHGDNNM